VKLSIKGLAITLAVLWGGSTLVVGLANLMWPTYGTGFLDVLRAIYPGFAHTSGIMSVIIGTLYAAVDGAVAGFLFGWLYNRVAKE